MNFNLGMFYVDPKPKIDISKGKSCMLYGASTTSAAAAEQTCKFKSKYKYNFLFISRDGAKPTYCRPANSQNLQENTLKNFVVVAYNLQENYHHGDMTTMVMFLSIYS